MRKRSRRTRAALALGILNMERKEKCKFFDMRHELVSFEVFEPFHEMVFFAFPKVYA